MNEIADFIFEQIMNNVSRCEIEVRLRKFFAELPINEIYQYIDDANHAFAELSTNQKTFSLKDDRLLFEKREWTFDQIVSVGSTATHLQIGCDHFDDLLLAHYGPAHRGPPDEHDVESRIQVAFAEGDYWLNRTGLGVSGPFNDHAAYLELQHHLLSAAHSPRRTNLILHASVVADHIANTSIVLAGGSGAGKSSLAAEFLFQGHTFVADDTAIVDAHTRELWWLRLPVRLKEDSWNRVSRRVADAFERWDSVCEAGDRDVWQLYPKLSAAKALSFSPPCTAIFFPIYDADVSTKVEEIQTLAALALMVQGGAWFDTSEEAMADTIKWLSATRCYSILFSSVKEAVAVIQGLLRHDAI